MIKWIKKTWTSIKDFLLLFLLGLALIILIGCNLFFRGKKNEKNNDHIDDVDPGTERISANFDEARSRISDRIKAILLKRGSDRSNDGDSDNS